MPGSPLKDGDELVIEVNTISTDRSVTFFINGKQVPHIFTGLPPEFLFGVCGIFVHAVDLRFYLCTFSHSLQQRD